MSSFLRVGRAALFISLGGLLALAAPQAVLADSTDELVRDATDTIREFMVDPDLGALQRMARKARALVIIPTLVKGGFIFGAEGGSAVMLARRPDGSWSYPAFYTAATGSFGLQIGGQVSQVVLVIRTDSGLRSILKDNVRLGAEASVAIGPVGVGVDAATTTSFTADIVAFVKSKGLFGGGALEGGVITSNADRNKRYYGQAFSGRQIVLDGLASNPQAEGLRRSLP